jgi:hypothetical protein
VLAWTVGLFGFGSTLIVELDRARTLQEEDTRQLAAEWVRQNVPAGTPMLTANLAFTPGYEFAPLFAYPPMDPLPYQWEYLMDPGRPQLRLSFDAARQRGGLYLWTSFVDGTLDGKPEHYREFLEFLRQLERCEILARFDPEGEPDPRIHALELGHLTVTGTGCARPGPLIQIVRIR